MSTNTSSGAQRELLSKLSTLTVSKGETCPRNESKQHTCRQESHRSRTKKEDSDSDSESESDCRPRHRKDCKQRKCRCVGEHRRGCERQECDCGYEQRSLRCSEQKRHCPVKCATPAPVSCHPNGIIPFASGFQGDILLANFTSTNPVVMAYGNITSLAPVPAPVPGAPTPLGLTIRPSGYSWVVPYDGLIRDLAVSVDIATVPATVPSNPPTDPPTTMPAPANPLLITPFNVNFTVIVSHSMPNNGLGHLTTPYVDSTLTAAVSFGGPAVTAVTPSSFYTATNLNSGVYVVRAGDRVTIRVQTASGSDPALAGIAEIELGSSLYYERVDLGLLFCGGGLANVNTSFLGVGGLGNLGGLSGMGGLSTAVMASLGLSGLSGAALASALASLGLSSSALSAMSVVGGLPGAGGNNGTGTLGNQGSFMDPRFPCCNLNSQFPYCGGHDESVSTSSRHRSRSRG